MKVSKSSTSGNRSVASLSKQDIQDIADAVGKIVIKHLGSRVGVGKALAMSGPSSVQMDETLIDVGVSTAGIQNASDAPLGKETHTEDNVSAAKDRLKFLKKKDK
jgi:hypothetical protein